MFDDGLFESRHQYVSGLLTTSRLHLCQRCIAPGSALHGREDRFVGANEGRRHREVDVFGEAVDHAVDLGQ
ncbi:MAG: hypothetical protein Q8N44_10115 [Rubrivivax sp.]|nr:hypothetical protein [Rubrivivax sp.]